MNRIVRVLRLDASVFDEIRRDASAMNQAIYVVLVANLLAGIGAGLVRSTDFLGTLILTLILGMLGWLIWTTIAYGLSMALWHARIGFAEMARVLSLAQLPLALGLFLFVPALGVWLTLLGQALALWEGAVALRTIMGLSTARALITALIGWAAVILLNVFLGGNLALLS